MKDPRAVVAMILAIGVVAVMMGGSILRIILHPEEPPNVEVAKVWGNLLHAIAGGLIGYITGHRNDDT